MQQYLLSKKPPLQTKLQTVLMCFACCHTFAQTQTSDTSPAGQPAAGQALYMLGDKRDVSLDCLGGETVTTYKMTQLANRTTGATPSGKAAVIFGYLPIPVADTSNLTAVLTNARKQNTPDTEQLKAQCGVVFFGMATMEKQLTQALKEELAAENSPATEVKVEPMRVESAILTALIGDKPDQRLVVLDSWSSAPKIPRKNTYGITWPLKDIKAFVKRPRLSLRATYAMNQVTTNIITEDMKSFLRKDLSSWLSGDDTMKDRIVVVQHQTASGSGGGLLGSIIGPSQNMKGETGSETNREIKRAVSRNLLQNLCYTAMSNTRVVSWIENPEIMKPERQDALATQLADRLIKNAETYEVEFQKADGTQGNIELRTTDQALPVNAAMSHVLTNNGKLTFSEKPSFQMTDSGNISGYGVTAAASSNKQLNQDASTDYSPQITSSGNTVIIPTKIRYYVVGADAFQAEVSQTWMDSRPKGSYETQDSSCNGSAHAEKVAAQMEPLVVSDEKSDTRSYYEAFPVGSTIESLFSYKRLCSYYPDFGSSWLPCDGRPLTGEFWNCTYATLRREELGWQQGRAAGFTYKIPKINPQAPEVPQKPRKKGPKTTSTPSIEYDVVNEIDVGGTVRLPDFRGAFSRGLDEFSDDNRETVRHIGDPETGRISGSWQGDALAKHRHFTPFVSKGMAPVWNKPEPANDYYVYGVTSPNRQPTDEGWRDLPRTGNNGISLETETRPQNVAVYRYIRVN